MKKKKTKRKRTKKQQKEFLRKVFFAGGIASIFLMLMIILIFAATIGKSVKESCMVAQQKYEGDCVESLTSLLDDDTNSFEKRNRAIWALGQLGDKRALEVLEKYYTGEIPKREPVDRMLSQYELKKAIKLVRGGKNMGTWSSRPDTFTK